MIAGAKSRAWFFPTSPRSPNVLLEELQLVAKLDGMPWGNATQVRFAEILAEHRGHDLSHFKDPAFTARDRLTRGPRLLGLIRLPKRGSRGDLTLTPAGSALLATGNRTHLFQRQVAKVQFPSPLHSAGPYSAMSIRPLMALIQIVKDVASLSKEELALFCLTTVVHTEVSSATDRIRSFRQALRARRSGAERKRFREAIAVMRIKEVYREDIDAGNIKVREGSGTWDLNRFLLTKHKNLRDYADATFRYMQATGLFTVDPRTQTMSLSKVNQDDALYLLDTLGTSALGFGPDDYDRYVEEYLGDPNVPRILKDGENRQRQEAERSLATLGTFDPSTASTLRARFMATTTRAARLEILQEITLLTADQARRGEAEKAAQDPQRSLTEIRDLYAAIARREGEVFDRPLMFEWNTWRAMVLLNDAIEVRPNFRFDVDGNPMTIAGAKQPDMVVEYRAFWLVVEVTLAQGHTQYEAEGESIFRHVGMFQRERQDAGDPRPVYGLFVAGRINETVVPFVQTQARFPVKFYSGPVRIVPMDRPMFENFVESACLAESFNSETLHGYLRQLFEPLSLGLDEQEWKSLIAAGTALNATATEDT